MLGDGHLGTMRAAIDLMASARGEAVFLISPETGRALTFEGLQWQSRSISVQLLESGLKQGDKVAFMMDNGLFTAELLLGLMYGGFVAVPLNVRAGVSQLSYMLDHCDANVVFVAAQYSGLFKEVIQTVKRDVKAIFSDVDGSAEVNLAQLNLENLPSVATEDAALLMYSSGTTGRPNGALHTHKSIVAHGRNSVLSHQLTEVDRSLLVLPLYHINAECVTLVPTLLSGGSIVVPRGFVVSEFWNWLDDYRCTWSALVPTIIGQLLDWKDPKAESRAACFGRIRFLRSSSAPLSPSLHREFLDKFNLPLIQAMGSSEGGNVFSNPVPPGVNKIGSPGLPWGFETRILGRNSEDLPAGEPGELLLRGDGMMHGYYKDPAGTAAALDAEMWLHTGDLAYRDEDGYFFVVGRSKELIIKGGMNIAPKQIDEVLESHPSVLEAAAVGVPDRYVGEEVVAFAVLRDKAQCSESELLSFCESRLGHFKTPARIHFVRDLPKGPSGKVQRLRLQEELATQSLSPAAVESHERSASAEGTSSTPIEGIIAETWARLLKLPSVDPQSNFFSLGGHSLLAIQCLAQLRDKLPVRLSLADFFENPTVAEQAAVILGRVALAGASSTDTSAAWWANLPQGVAQPAVEETIPARDRSLPCPLSPHQRRLWFMEQVVGGEPVYNEAEAARLRGNLDVEGLETALNAIVARRENLRTSIRTIDNEPTVFVHDDWELKLKRLDLSSLAPHEREAEVARLLIDEPRLPYQLDREPAIRATLLRLGPTEHILILMMHHIICDWASMGNFWRDLSALYRAGCRGQPLELPAPPIQYGDYAAWQNDLSNRGAFAEDLTYWRRKLSGAPALLELPTDRPRPPVSSYRGAKRRFAISAALTHALREYSRQEKVTLFTVFATALNVLFYRYTGQEDIVLGIPLADRDLPELQTAIGFLLHTHALRTQISDDLRVRDLLLRVQKDALDLYVHRAPPFDQVVTAVQPPRSASYSPLFQVMLNWRDRDQLLSFIGLEGLEVEMLLAASRTAKFDLTLMLTDGDKTIDLEIEHSADLFDEATIERLAGHFSTLLEGITADPDARVSELPLLTSAERQQALVEWNATTSPYPKDRCLHELFEEQAARGPDAVAVTFEDRRWTYRELNERADRLARRLSQFGVGPDTLVAVCVERSLDMVAALLGVHKAGGAYVPLDPAYPRERLAYMLRDSEALVVLTETRLRSRFETDGLKAGILCLDKDWDPSAGLVGAAPLGAADPENLAYVIYTSGSTGAPKGVQIRHRNLVNLLSAMASALRFTARDKLLALTTISFDIAGLELFLPLISGGRLEVAPTAELRDGFALRRRMEGSGATVVQATPATWMMLIDAGWTGDRTLRALCGGEAVSPALAESLSARASEVWNVYGPTETTIWSSFDRIEPGRPITIGRPIANTQLYVVDKGRRPVPIGVPGELLIGGDGVAQGYLRRPELTAEKFVADPFAPSSAPVYRTGDLVRRSADGRIEWLARLDQQVKIRGFRIELGEIESVLTAHPAVREAVALAREDQPGDKRLVAYVTAKEGEPPTGSELRDWLRAKLPEHMIPPAVVILVSFPLTPNGKIDRKALPRPEIQPSLSEEFDAPATETEKALSDIWSRALGVERVGLRDNFFELGGHSLLALRVISQINMALKARLSVPEFFHSPTIERLAKAVEQKNWVGREAQVVRVQDGRTGLPLYFIGARPEEYRLAKLLGNDRPIFIVDVPIPLEWHRAIAAADQSAMPTVEQLGALYSDSVRAHAGSSPFVILGYSLGGKIAFEAAHALRRAGGNLGLVLLVDAWAFTWTGATRGPLLQGLGSILRGAGTGARNESLHLASLRSSIAESRRLSLWLMARLPRMFMGRLQSLKNGFSPKARPSGYLDKQGVGIDQSDIDRLVRIAGSGWRPRPLDASGALFRAHVPNEDLLPGYDFSNGWGKLFDRDFKIVQAAGDHSSMVLDENLPALARQINSVLDRYEAEHAVGMTRPKHKSMLPA
jgi:amino acid adenylation domain-containing protein